MYSERLLRIVLCSVCLLILCGESFAYNETNHSDESQNDSTIFLDKVINLAEGIMQALTIEPNSGRWSLATYPAASYGHRTGFEIGIMPLLRIKSSKNLPASSITPAFLISTKRMWEVQCDMEIYPSSWLTINAKTEWMRLPDEYYGKASKDGKIRAKMLTRTLVFDNQFYFGSNHFRIGPALHYYYASFSEIDSVDYNFLSASNELRAANGHNLGFGVAFRVDTRDNNEWPSCGFLLQGEISGWHGDKGFFTGNIDWRTYHHISLAESVIATQLYFGCASSKTPFFLLPTFGGTRRDRAVNHNLKYINDMTWLFQAEWRIPLFWRLGATIWGGGGNDFGCDYPQPFKDSHAMAGLGLRLKIFPKSGLNMRLDAGIGSHGDHAIYLNIREAF
ncbi:MAG: hypothetical protein HUJ96_09235 [Marinilabiliaceae bacterium]|nr:hypothetical protein [Marinilabiliaceae bacterium]